MGPYKETHPNATSWTRKAPTELQRQINEQAVSVKVASSPNGRGIVEICTVEHGRDGPNRAIFIGRMTDGPDAGLRFIATSSAKASFDLVASGKGIGALGVVSSSGDRSTFTYAASKL